MEFWGIYVLIGLVLLIQVVVNFTLLAILKILKIINITTIETAKQINIIDRNTYPKQNKKSL